ncbi:16S rRNA (cytosine(1402)-N(4))-methyltransferase RsmH [Patescibacteria group bacterium]|nr:16S rRNA (cytosine(1402)-N(4))-methyltransferase RsmH [Patescibacteria group bacterium]
MPAPEHLPVLLEEVLKYLDPQLNQNVVDLTLGGGGHAAAILEETSPDGFLLGFDWDTLANKQAENNLKRFPKQRYEIVSDNFVNLKKVVNVHPRIHPISAILLDLGLSSYAIEDKSRGFSFLTDGPLDMRFSGEGQTAADLLNNLTKNDLSDILWEYGDEKYASEITSQILKTRQKQKFKNCQQLVAAVLQVYRHKRKPKKIHPVTKTFQALRIAVNNELNNLTEVLPQAQELLAPGGKLAVISFHSKEDRIVKNYFRQEARDCLCPPSFPECRCGHLKQLQVLTKKPIAPSLTEINNNPRSRSAKLRVAQKIY